MLISSITLAAHLGQIWQHRGILEGLGIGNLWMGKLDFSAIILGAEDSLFLSFENFG